MYQITSQLRARSDTLNQLHTGTEEDDELILLKHMITNGWPTSIKEVPPEIQAYWMFCEEEGTDLNKSLVIYRNTPLSHMLQSPMQILQSRTARTQLPMSSTARIQQGLGSEQLRVNNKN